MFRRRIGALSHRRWRMAGARIAALTVALVVLLALSGPLSPVVQAQGVTPSPGDEPGWVWQDPDGSVHIHSSLYKAEILGDTGSIRFRDAAGQDLFEMDCSITDRDGVQVTRSGRVPVISLAVDGDAATVTLVQSAPEVTFTTTCEFRRCDGLMHCHERLTYGMDRWISEERLILHDRRSECSDDDGGNDYPYAYIDAAKRQRKDFELAEVPGSAVVRAYAGWREENGDSRFDSRLLMSVNGRDYDVTGLLTFPETPSAGPTHWIEQSIDPADLQVGINQIAFRLAPRIGTEYFYLGLDLDTDHDRSAFSVDNGQNWSYDDLSAVSGLQNGEYMVRLINGATYRSDLVTCWDGARSAFANMVPQMTRYSPRIMRTGFSTSGTRLSIYGSRLGAGNIESLHFDGLRFLAYLYNQAHNGIDCVVDPSTGMVIDPVNHTEYAFNNVYRRAGDVSEARLALVFEQQHPPLLVVKSRWPRNHKAAWTLGDDTDSSTAATKRAVYYGTSNVNSPDYGKKGFVGHNLKTTVTTWWQPGAYGIQDNNDHRAVMTDLYNRGFEVGLHTATQAPDNRVTTAAAIQAFSELYDTFSWLEHSPQACQAIPSSNHEDIVCWGKVPSDPDYYVLDILENSAIRYISQASNSMLYGRWGDPVGLFANPRLLPHESCLIDDAGSTKRLVVHGRQGSGWEKCIHESRIDELIDRHELFIGLAHTGWPGESWFEPGIGRIRDEVEAHLAHMAGHQAAGELWVEPTYRILDWMLDLESVTITGQSGGYDPHLVSITNGLDKDIAGVTLIATGTIAEATIDGAHQIYVDGASVVLPVLAAQETKSLVIRPGEYPVSMPRLTVVDVDVSILQAEYAAEVQTVTVRPAWTGAGIPHDRSFSFSCGAWPCLTARHNGLLFAVVALGALTGSDAAYQVHYDGPTGTLTFSIPDLTGDHEVILRPCKGLIGRPDFDFDNDVDQEDFGHLQACLSGPDEPQNDPACANALLDEDADVDAEDMGIFLGCRSGPGLEAPSWCRD